MRWPREHLRELLDNYLSRLQAKETTLEDLLAEGSDRASTLRPLLETAILASRQMQPSSPSESFTRNATIRLLNQIQKRKGSTSSIKRHASGSHRARSYRTAAWALSIFLAFVLLLGSVGVIQASATSLPGDGLYPLKRGVEEFRLALTFDTLNEAQLLGEFTEERIRELECLLNVGRTQDLNAAVQAYLATLDRFSDAAEKATTDDGSSGNQSAQDRIGRNVAVLQGLLAKVPLQAQAAIQRAIDRSMQHRLDMETRQHDRNQRQAQQISRLYSAQLEDVFGIFTTLCDQKWSCVRKHYRDQEREGATPSP